MKRLIFFSVFFILLIAAAWGQDTYTLTDSWQDTNEWTTLNLWRVNGAVPTTYPGQSPGDSVVIAGSQRISIPTGIVSSLNALESLTMDSGTLTISDSSTPLKVTTLNVNGNLTLTGEIEVTGTTFLNVNLFSNNIDGALSTVGLIIGNINNVQTGNFTVGGGTLSFSNTTFTITGVTSNIGTLGAPADRNLTITTAGNIAIGEIISAANVTITSSGAVTVGSVNATSFSGPAGNLTVNGNIVTSANQTYTGAVSLPATGRTFRSTGGNIAFSGAVTGSQLIAIARSGTVTVGGSVNLSHTGSEGENAAMYVFANNFSITNTTANSISPGGTNGQLCLMLGTPWNGTNQSSINGAENVRWHQQHTSPPVTGDLVFYSGTQPTDIPGSPQFVNSTSLSADTVYSVGSPNNIYIVNVGANPSFAVTFLQAGTGFIEIRGNYEATNINLNPGSGGIQLNGAAVNLASKSFDTGGRPLTQVTDSTNSITAAGITLNTVTGNGGVINLTSSQDININGSVTGSQLLMDAGSANVTIAGSATVNVTGNGDHDNAAAIYVRAANFTAMGTATTGLITPGTGQLCLNLSVTPSISPARVAGGCYHVHIITGPPPRHLVYYSGVEPNAVFTPSTDYEFIPSSDAETTFSVTPNKNIYIYNVGSNGAKNLSFTVDTGANRSGFIEIRGTYTSTGTLTLSAGTGGVRLDGATVNLGSNDFDIQTQALTLIGTSTNSITAAAVTLGEITGNGSSLTIIGNATLNGGSDIGALEINGNPGDTAKTTTINNAITAASVNIGATGATGLISINANITTIGNQSYAGPVALSSTLRTLTSTGGSVTATGIVSGTAGITVNALQGITLNAANTLSGNVTLNNNQSTSASGNITFTNTSTSVNLTANNNTASGTITVNQTGALVIASASTPANGSITLTTIGANSNLTQTGAITTTGTLTINSGGAVTLTNAANNAATLSVTGAGGAVQFTNSAALAIAGVSGENNNNVTITTTGASDITQTGAITTTGTLALNSGGAITLTNTANNAATLSVTGAGGAVQFTNSAALAIAGVSGVNNNNVTISSAGSVTVSGNINAGTGAIALTSGNNQDITIGATISGYSLALIAGTSTGTVTINAAVTVSSPNATAHTEDAAVYIKAGSFAGSGNIVLSSTGWVCAYIDNAVPYTGTVTDNRIHYHLPSGKHIVYRPGGDSGSYNDITAGSYLYLQADTSLGANINYDTTGAGNVYIIGIASGSGQANTRAVNFSTESGGFIEIRGDYTSSGTLTLNAGSGGVRLVDADIVLNGANNNFNIGTQPLTLVGTGGNNSITAANITLGTITGGANNLTINGNAMLNGGSAIGALEINGNATFSAAMTTNIGSVSVSGISTISANITTTGDQTYTGAVTLGADVNLSGGSSSKVLFSSTVNGAYGLTITTANVQFSAAVGGATALTSVNVTAGTSTINANISTTGAQTYTGAVTLGANVNFTANAGSLIWFNTSSSTIKSNNATARSITITNANARFDGVVGDVANPISSLSVAGTSTIGANITTTGAQTFTGAVTLSGTGARTLTGTSVTMGAITGDNHALTIHGSATLNGGTAIGALAINTATGDTARTTTINNAISAASVTIGSTGATGLITIKGNVTDTTAGNTTATPQRYYGPVVLGADVTFSSGGTNHIIRFDNNVDSDSNSTPRSLTVATAILRFSVPVGVTSPLASVTATGTGPHRLVQGVRTTGDQTYENVRLGNTANTSVTLSSTAGTIRINGNLGSNNTTAHALTVTSGDVVFGGAVGINGNPISTLTVNGTGNTTFNAAVSYTTGVAINSTGTVNFNNATVTTTGGTGVTQLYTGPVVLGANVTFMTGNVNRTVRFNSTVNGAFGLTITTANVQFSAAVGGITALASVSVDATATATINADISTSANQSYTGTVTLGGAGARTLTSSGGDITTTGTVTATGAVKIIAANLLTIGNGGISASGNSVELDSTDGNIAISGEISASNLSIITKKTTGTVTLTGSEDITVGNNVLNPNECPEGKPIVIYIRANTFTATAYSGNITPGSSPYELCLDVDSIIPDPPSCVDPDRFHKHAVISFTDRHIVYGPAVPSDITGPIHHEDSTTSTNTSFKVAGGFNIYIVGVGGAGHANLHNMDFTANGTGFIEIRGNYGSTHALELSTQSGGGIRLNDAAVNLSGASNNFNIGSQPLTLLGSGISNSITAAAVTLGAITGGGNNLTIRGNTTLNGGTAIGNLLINGSAGDDAKTTAINAPISASSVTIGSTGSTGTITIGGNITTTGGAQTYTGAVTLTGASTGYTLTGTTVTLGAITGGGRSLSIFGNAALNGGSGINGLLVEGNATFSGAMTTSIGYVSVTNGTSTIGADISTSGTQSYGAVILTGSSATRTLTGTSVKMGAITGGGNSLTVTGNAELNGGTDIGALTISGTAEISADISTNGAQNYGGAVTLSGTGDRTLSAGTTITTTGTVTRTATTGAVIIKAANLLTISGGITAGTGSPVTGNSVTLESTTGNIAISGAITAANLSIKTPKATGTVTLSGTGAITVGNNVLNPNDCPEIADHPNVVIYISANIFNADDYTGTITPGTAASYELCLNVNIFTPSPLTRVDGGRYHSHTGVSISGQYLVYGPSIPADIAALYASTLIHFEDSTTSTNTSFKVDADFHIYIVDVGGSDHASTHNMVFTTSGTGFIEIRGNYASSGALTLNAGSGGVRLNDVDVNLSGAANSFNIGAQPLTLLGSGNNNSITAAVLTLGAITGGGNNLTINGNATLDGGTGIGNLTIDGAAAINADISTNGNQTYTGAITGGEIKLDAGGNITINSSIDATNLSIKTPKATGTVTITGAGDITVGGNDLTPNECPERASYPNVVIYIRANTFDARSYSGTIFPGTAAPYELCLDVNILLPNPLSRVDDDRYHDHVGKAPVLLRILYSFTEDLNGNGRLDRIRVQTNLVLNETSGFDVIVEGYKVNDFTLASAPNNDSFYINLNERSEFDGKNTPQWQIVSLGSLALDEDSLNKRFTPIDTIPPRIAYTLTLPGHPGTYLHLTESVNSADAEFTLGGTLSLTSVSPIGDSGILLDLSASFTINDLDGLNITNGSLANAYFSVDNLTDNSTGPSLDSSGIKPKYPVDWSYTNYAEDIGGNVFKPPHSLIDTTVPLNTITPFASSVIIRRVSDILVSISPPSEDYFAWPVWARNEKGTISQFNGSAFLEEGDENVELQARINAPSLSGSLRLIYRTTERTNNRGLWQPFPSQYYFAPAGGSMLSPTDNTPLFNYNFPAINSGSRVEFYLYTGSMYGSTPNTDQFIARLDIPSGAAIPSNWYGLVRPFAFDIQNVRTQRGGVSVLNNVINSNNRENAYIRYDLPRAGRVTIQIYTLEGNVVKSLRRNEHRDAGTWTDTWDGSNNAGRAVARGMYFVRVVGPDIDEIRKIMVIK